MRDILGSGFKSTNFNLEIQEELDQKYINEMIFHREVLKRQRKKNPIEHQKLMLFY
jgi:hypothetical protein